MAKIVLNVELGQKQVLKDLELLKSGIKNIASSLGDVKVNKDLTAQLNALTKNYNALAKAAQAAQKVNNKQALSEQKLAKATAQASTAKINEQKASVQLETAQIRLTKAQQQGTKTVKTATQANEKHKQSILSMAAGFFEWQLAAAMVMKPLYAIRSAWASINDTLVKTEDAVVSLQRVLNDDSLSGKTISGKLYELAAKYGQTFDNANEIAQNFARTGMDWNETIKATEAALLALNVAELDATQASDGLIAIMQQFGYEASNLTGIIDILNKTADNYAVTTDKLLTALQRTGSSAKNANLSLEQTVGIVTALSEATGRSGENLGTAVNSLIQFSTKSSALDTFAKLSDNMAKLVEDFRHGKGTVLDIWQGLSAEIKNASGNTENILSGLFGDDDWRSLNAELQEALGEEYSKVTEIYDTASTFRKNYFIALLNNMDTVEKAIGTASNAAGYSQKENEKYLDTYTAKVNKLNAQWEYLANNEQGYLSFKKGLVDIGSWLLTITEYTGGLRTVVIALTGGLISVFPAIRAGLSAISTKITEITGQVVALNTKAGLVGLVATMLSVAIGGIDNAITGNREQRAQEAKEQAEANAKMVKSSLQSIENYKKLAEESEAYGKQVENLRAILSDTTATEERKTAAQEDLLSIQNLLIESNKAYADSLDLINGNLSQQIGLVNKLSDERLKQQAQEFLEKNKAGIQTAKNQINDTTETESILFEGNGIDRHKFRDVLKKAVSGSGVNASVVEDNTYGIFHNYGKRVGEGFQESFWDGLGEVLGFETVFDETSYVGKAKAGLNFSGTVTEQIEQIKKLKDYVNLNYESLGITLEEANIFSQELSTLLSQLDTAEYKNANELVDTAKLYEDFLNGAITKAEFLKEVYGIELVDTTKSWADQSKEVVKNYQDILDIINKTRDTQQAIVDLEEKKKALEDARNNRNVRVYNASTGNWELQADMGAVADAEKAYEDAVLNNLQNELEAGNLTAGEIYEKVKEIAVDLPYLAMTIRDAFVAQGYNMPEYDSGGVLRGLGGIKATSQDEIVLPPDLAKKILQPTTNAEFAQFAKSLGLLFGSSKQIADMKSGMVVNNGGGSSTDNRSYVANGVPFTRETAETHTLVELFEMAANFNN